MSNGHSVQLMFDDFFPDPSKPCRLRIQRINGAPAEGVYVSHNRDAVTLVEDGNPMPTVIQYEKIPAAPNCVERII